MPPSFYWDNTMNDFLSWVEGARERQESDRYFSMSQTCLVVNAIRNQWGDNGFISVDELMGRKTEDDDKVALSDFASKEQFDEYMRQRRREK